MNNALEIKNLCVEVEGQLLLNQLNLTIPAGEVHALLGPNGCGKTTLLLTIMGYPQYKVREGQILFEGRNITNLDITTRARLGIGIAQQRAPTIAGVKLQDLVNYIVEKRSQPSQKINEWTRTFYMEPFLKRDINAAFSGGEIKRSELFQLLITQPRLAMLDEPDSGIDLETVPLIGQIINTLLLSEGNCPVKRRAALIITHTSYILDYVEADKAHIMLHGRIECSGNPGLMIAEIRRSGYEGCVRCMQQVQEVVAL
jgi:Fe-S cluster assembly ATP-binding protein